MSKRRDTGSHPVEELEMKDIVSYNAAVQFNPKRFNAEPGKGEHQKGQTGKKGGDVRRERENNQDRLIP